METRKQLKEIMSLLDENPEARAEFEKIIDDYYTKWEDSIRKLKEAGIVESIPAFISVYGTHGDGNYSFACSPEMYSMEQRLRYLSSYQHPINRVTINKNGDCYICITTEQLKKFANTMANKYSIPMRGAEEYPYIVLKLTNDQLMRLSGENIYTEVSFYTDKGEDITKILNNTRTCMKGRPYIEFPQISLYLNKDKISLNSNDIQIIKAILILFKRGGVLDDVNRNEFSNSIRITNNNMGLSISEMIYIAQHILPLMDDDLIRSEEHELEYMIENDDINNHFFNYRSLHNGAIDCTGINEKEIDGSNKLKIDIAYGICTQSNIKKIYNYLMDKSRGYLRILPELNALAAKVQDNTFDQNDKEQFDQLIFPNGNKEMKRVIGLFNKRKDIHSIVQILSELQDQENPIIPQEITEAVETAIKQDPCSIITPIVMRMAKVQQDGNRPKGGWQP